MIDNPKKTCALKSCGKVFMSKIHNQKCCSNPCKRRFNYEKSKVLNKNKPKEYSHSAARLSEQIFDSNYGLTQMFYKYETDQEKLDLCLELLELAVGGSHNYYRQLLTANYYRRPDLKKYKLFFGGDSHNTKTISEIVNSVCWHIFNKSSLDVIKSKDFTPCEDCDLTSIPMSNLARRQYSESKFKTSYKPSDLTTLEIDDVMEGRPEWVKDMRKSIQSPDMFEPELAMAA